MPDPTRPISKIPRVANRHRQETPFSLKEKKIQAAIISLNEEKAFDYYLLKTITAATTLIAERIVLRRHFSERIDRIFKNSSYCIHYRFLMLYQVLPNFCV